MNIHIFHDDKFTNGAIEQFEQSYPNQNVYIVLLYEGTTLHYTQPNDKIITYHIRNKNLINNINRIISQNKINNLFIHYLDTFKASLSLKIISNFGDLKFYWIFYGGDLYDYLTRYHKYDILDGNSLKKNTRKDDIIKNIKYLLWFGWTTKSALKRAFRRLDYFCFWNEFDFQLFHKHLDTKAIHKEFIYFKGLGNPNLPLAEKKNIIMINHSASPSGNHFFVIDTIKSIYLFDNNYKVLLPLSYGDKTYAEQIVAKAQNTLSCNIEVLRDFMPLIDYQTKLSEVKIAIFGMKRQEAAGNIFQLLNMGAKVFLRKDNTLFHWLKKRDFIVFSLEEDQDELQNLNTLSEKQISHNKSCYSKHFNEDVYKIMMEKLVENN